MKKYMEEAFKKAANESKINIVERAGRVNVLIENAAMVFHKFNGEADEFGSTTRKATFIIPEDTAIEFKNRGWNVKEIETKDPDMPYIYGIKVLFKTDGQYPPMIKLICKDVARELNNDTVSLLDSIEIENIDIIINVSFNSKIMKGRNPYTFYAKSMFVTQYPELGFGSKYDNIDRDPELKEQLEDNIDAMFNDPEVEEGDI